MSLQEITALIRRHFIAVLLVAAVAMGAAFAMKRTPLMYQESSTVVFTMPSSLADPNPYSNFDGSLIETAGTMTLLVMSPQGQAQVRAAGGKTSYNVALVNSYNLEYPSFGSPDVTVTATSQDPNEVHQTFMIVTNLLKHELTAQQERVGVAPEHRIGMVVLSDYGPISLPGSMKRSFAGLLVLAIVAAFSVATFLDRHPFRLGLRVLRRLWAKSGSARPHTGKV